MMMPGNAMLNSFLEMTNNLRLNQFIENSGKSPEFFVSKVNLLRILVFEYL